MANHSTEVWTIYKEVATYYAAGLNPPDDVTIIMPDDNQGQVQRLPTGNESAREGGIGVYFHFEYFGSPRSYKWSNSNNLVSAALVSAPNMLTSVAGKSSQGALSCILARSKPHMGD